MRVVYTLLWWIVLPLLPLRLWWRGRREATYRLHIGERFGRYAGAARAVGNDVVWIHAVSVGETRAVAPLVERTNAENDSNGSGSGASTFPLLATDPWPCVPWHCQQPYFMKATLPCSADAASAAPSPKSAPTARTASAARNI